LHSFNYGRRQNDHCLENGKSILSSLLSPVISFSSAFRNLRTLSITRLRSPRNRTLFVSIDEELSSFLNQFLAVSKNTAIFVLSPSGLRGTGLSGVVEEKSPLFSAWFPSEFRRNRNAHYSAFVWNMDKLFTTRDVHVTLQQLASARLPEAIEWRNYDLEHHQETSLLSEMLPEERNCTTLAIPAQNCLCLGADDQRNSTANGDVVLYRRVIELIESRAQQEPCVEGIQTDKQWSYLNAYRMFAKELDKELDKESSDLEWLTVVVAVKMKKEHVIHGGSYGPTGEAKVWIKAMLRHFISSDLLEYVEAVITDSKECFAVHLERMCSVCYSSRFWYLSVPGPNKGFLLDNETDLK
ncbi:hypothetical protein PMAYCL1PPCAC_00172, partial [Pristionchus mayeri]